MAFVCKNIFLRRNLEGLVNVYNNMPKTEICYTYTVGTYIYIFSFYP